MDYKKINKLLDKYFLAETNREEERELQAFFQQEEIPKKLMPYRPFFRYIEAEKERELSEGFETRLLKELDRKKRPANRLRHLAPLLQRAAALLLLALAIWWIYPRQIQPQPINWAQYEPESPEEAFLIMRSALHKTSEEFNDGTKQLATGINKMDKIGDYIKK